MGRSLVEFLIASISDRFCRACDLEFFNRIGPKPTLAARDFSRGSTVQDGARPSRSAERPLGRLQLKHRFAIGGLPTNQGVVGSNPAGRATTSRTSSTAWSDYRFGPFHFSGDSCGDSRFPRWRTKSRRRLKSSRRIGGSPDRWNTSAHRAPTRSIFVVAANPMLSCSPLDSMLARPPC